MVGSIGVWWPGRRPEHLPLSPTEERYSRSSFEEAGYRVWGIFNILRNNSTRCETGAALVAKSPKVETNIGIDNKTSVDTGN